MNWSELVNLAGLPFDISALNLPQKEQFYPGTMAPIIATNRNEQYASRMYWGLVPDFWNKPLEEKRFSTFNYNSRAQDWLQKPTYRKAIRTGRCLIPATYFCEYSGEKGKKITVPFARPDGGIFAMAGVFNHWQGIHKGEQVQIDTFSMLTTHANEVVAPIHPKAMPVLLEWEQADQWLNGTLKEAIELAVPCPNNRLVQQFSVK